MKKTNEKAITLIALVITIIVLLILAGVTISTLTGENGILSMSKKASENYSIAQAKEKLELAIAELKIVQESKNEQLTKESLTQLDNDEISVGSVENFSVEIVVERKYKFNVDENFVVTYVGEADGTIITYTTEPVGYTNGDEVKILLKATSPKGIKEVIDLNDKTGDSILTTTNNKTEVAVDYTVTKNGTYSFKIIDNENNETIKDVVIDNFDKIVPLDFTPIVKDIELHQFTIVTNAQDAEKTDTSSKSGIGKYEYYIKKSIDSDYTKYDSENGEYIANNLDGGTEYSFYIIVYDRAGNSKMSDVIVQETDVQTQDIYINSTNGNDRAGDGTEANPYLSLEKLEEDGIIQTGIKYNVYLGNGEYNLKKELFTLNCNKSINIYGNKQNTILNVNSIFANSLGGSTDYSINIYRLVWNAISTDANNIALKTEMRLYNVAMKLNFDIIYYSYIDTFNNFDMVNCTLSKYIAVRVVSDYRKHGFLRWEGSPTCGLKLTNCYGGYTSGWATTDDMWNYKTNYITSNPLVDSTTYRITDTESVWKNVGTGTDPDGSQADLGVYGGEYSWEN